MDSTQSLADKQAISELIYIYCRAVDRLDIPLGHRVFHADSHADYGADFYQGPGRGVIDAIIKSHENLLSHSHQVSNILIALDGESAGSEAYVTGTMRMMRDAQLMQIGVWGRYCDRWERRDGQWAIIHRKVVYDHEEIRPVTAMGRDLAKRDRKDPSYSVLKGL